MKLIDLNPRFVGAGGEGVSDSDGNPVPERHGVGVSFDCPCGCSSRCYIPFHNPIDGGAMHETHLPHDGWHRVGEDFETLTLTPSIQRVGGCQWHGFLTDGELKSV